MNDILDYAVATDTLTATNIGLAALRDTAVATSRPALSQVALTLDTAVASGTVETTLRSSLQSLAVATGTASSSKQFRLTSQDLADGWSIWELYRSQYAESSVSAVATSASTASVPALHTSDTTVASATATASTTSTVSTSVSDGCTAASWTWVGLAQNSSDTAVASSESSPKGWLRAISRDTAEGWNELATHLEGITISRTYGVVATALGSSQTWDTRLTATARASSYSSLQGAGLVVPTRWAITQQRRAI